MKHQYKSPIAGALGPRVKTQSGVVQGTVIDGIATYKGIPYAQPPVGDLRWRPPKPAVPWSGVWDATEYGNVAFQPEMLENPLGSRTPSEDCLTLNIFAPQGARALPVMFWIHGGGLFLGSGSDAEYDGVALAQQGIVLVTINYRLGPMGFFAHGELTREAAGSPTANFGYMDQIAALKWVRDNIARFGGDPGKITIFGESAGGTSVNSLMASPVARGLFHGAIAQSAVGRVRSMTLQQAEAAGEAFAAKAGAKGNDPASLRALPVEVIYEVYGSDPSVGMNSGAAPVKDGIIVKEDAVDAFAAGRVVDVPYLTGSTDVELPLPYVPAVMQRWLDDLGPERRRELIQVYGGEEAFNLHYVSDVAFTEPSYYFADAHHTRAPTFQYRFAIAASAVADRFNGAPHASDVMYVFGNTKASRWPLEPNHDGLARTVSAHWVAFAKTGNPNSPSLPTWEQYSRGKIMTFTNHGPIYGEDPWHDRIPFLTNSYGIPGIMPILGQK